MDRGDSEADLVEHSEPVDRLGPGDPLSLSEQPASSGPLPVDGTGDDPMYREDSTTLSAGRDEPVDRLCVSGRPVVIRLASNDEGWISTGLVDSGLKVANQRKWADRPTRMMPNNENEQLVFLGVEVERGTDAPDLTPVPDDVMIRDRSSSDGRAEPVEEHRPGDTTRTHAENDINGSMAGGPVGQLDHSDPLRPRGAPSMDDALYPLTLDPVGQPPITGSLDRPVSEMGWGREDRIQNDPEGSSGILDTASQDRSNVSANRLNIGTVGRVATSVGATPSSDSGVHSWKEQWENMSELSSDDASGQPVQPDWSGPERGHMNNIRTPPNTEEEGDSDYPWRDRMVSGISCELLSDTRREENNGGSYIG